MRLKSILFLFILWFLSSCDKTTIPKEDQRNLPSVNNSTPKEIDQQIVELKKPDKKKEIPIEIKDPIKPVFSASDYLKEGTYIAVQRSRIKASPKIFGKNLSKIEYGGLCTFLQVTSEKKETIELKGEQKTDYWMWMRQVIPDPTGQGGVTEIEGWVFGGEVMKATEIYTKTSPDHYERKIIKASADNLTDILGFKVHIPGYYDGTVHYRINKEDQWQKNGKFSVKFFRQLETSGKTISLGQDFSGNYSSDVPHGLFERNLIGTGNDRHSKIFYENGNCLWSESNEIVNGKDHIYREEMPAKCDFEYIEKEMYKREFNAEF